MAEFPLLPPNPGKQDEVDWLCALGDSIPENTHLHGLITPNLIAWFAAQMRDDLSVDIHEAFLWERNMCHALQMDVARLGQTIKDQKCEAQDIQARATQVAELANAWQERADKLARLNDLLGDEIVELKAKLYDYLAADLAARNEEEVNCVN